jgi:hypothetical protein
VEQRRKGQRIIEEKGEATREREREREFVVYREERKQCEFRMSFVMSFCNIFVRG